MCGGRDIQLLNEAVLFTKSDFVMLMLFPAFDQEFRVRGDGLCVHCILSLECGWFDGCHQLFGIIRKLTKIRHRGGDTVQGGLWPSFSLTQISVTCWMMLSVCSCVWVIEALRSVRWSGWVACSFELSVILVCRLSSESMIT